MIKIDHMENLGVDRRVLLKWTLKKYYSKVKNKRRMD